MASKLETDAVEPQSGTTLTLGAAGDTVDLSTAAVTLPAVSVTAGNLASSLDLSGKTVTLPAASVTAHATGTQWQAVQTAAFTAVAGNGYPCDTTSSAFTMTLPAAASVGDTIELVDYAGTFDTNRLTVDPQSLNIKGVSATILLAQEREGVRLVYVDATQGWRAVTSTASLPVWFEPYNIEYLIVAGGGGGGTGNNGAGSMGGGGGGAGGYRTSTLEVSPDATLYNITVGAGGAGATPANQGGDGSDGDDSVISTTSLSTNIVSIGGGGGGGRNRPGRAGGSGGGGSAANNPPGAGTAGQGYAGGNGATSGNSTGGGGGASEVGDSGLLSPNPPTNNTLQGGDGIANDILVTGTDVYYAGGGGGCNWGSHNFNACQGGLGGGGNGGQKDAGAGQSGTDGLGGGAGGDYYVSINNGGDGVVILRMLSSDYTGTITGSPTITTDGDYKVLKYLSSGTYTS